MTEKRESHKCSQGLVADMFWPVQEPEVSEGSESSHKKQKQLKTA